MPPKRKGKKGVKAANLAKIEKLTSLLALFRDRAKDHEIYLNSLCKSTCDQITKYYNEKMRSIPDHIRKMTVSEIMELAEKESRNSNSNITPEGSSIRTVFEKNKLLTDKKTQKKDKKRSMSASRPAPRIRDPSNMVNRLSRSCSETSSMPKQTPKLLVTPKFNPKLPVSIMARRPKANEVIMSLGGSPIKFFDDEGISLNLGSGKVIKFGEDVEMDENLLNDAPTLKTLETVKTLLDKILLDKS